MHTRNATFMEVTGMMMRLQKPAGIAVSIYRIHIFTYVLATVVGGHGS